MSYNEFRIYTARKDTHLLTDGYKFEEDRHNRKRCVRLNESKSTIQPKWDDNQEYLNEFEGYYEIHMSFEKFLKNIDSELLKDSLCCGKSVKLMTDVMDYLPKGIDPSKYVEYPSRSGIKLYANKNSLANCNALILRTEKAIKAFAEIANDDRINWVNVEEIRIGCSM